MGVEIRLRKHHKSAVPVPMSQAEVDAWVPGNTMSVCGVSLGTMHGNWQDVNCETCIRIGDYTVKRELLLLYDVVYRAREWVTIVGKGITEDSPADKLKRTIEALDKFNKRTTNDAGK